MPQKLTNRLYFVANVKSNFIKTSNDFICSKCYNLIWFDINNLCQMVINESSL